MKTIHAYTEPPAVRGRPAYAEVLQFPDGRHVLRVRSRESFMVGCNRAGEIEMSPKELAEMALAILDHFNVLDLAKG